MTNEVNNGSVTVNQTPETQPLNQGYPDSTINPTVNMAQPPKENPLKKFGIAPIIGIAVVVFLLVAGVIFKTVTSSPKTVFKNSINNLYKGLNKGIDEVEELNEKFDFTKKALILNGDVKFDASENILKNITGDYDIKLNDYSIGAELGVDINNERMALNAFLKGKSEKIEVQTYFEDGAAYVGSTLFDGLIKTEDVEIDFNEFTDLFNEIEENTEFEAENYDYVIKAIKNALVKSLDNKYMEKDSDEIKIAGEKVKVTKYSYTLNEEAVQSMARSITEQLLDDKEFSKKLAKLIGEEKSDIEDQLKEMKKTSKDIEFDGKVVINVYQKGLFNTSAGLSIKIDKKEYFHYYTDGDNHEIKFDDNGGEYYGTVVEIVSKKKNKESEVTLEYNGEKVGEFTIRELSDKKMDFDYKIIDEDEEVKGTIYFTYNEEKTSIKGDYKFKLEYEGEYVSLEGSYGIESKDSLSKVDSSKVISEDDLDEEKVLEKIEEIAKKDQSFQTLLDIIKDQEEESIKSHLNSYGMYSVETSEIESIVKRSKPTVLFVGSSYYSSYSDEAGYTLFENIQKVQNELDFYSYFYNSYNVNDNFKDMVKDAKITCKYKDNTALEPPVANPVDETQTPGVSPTAPTEEFANNLCSEYPVLYFIKDGKVVSALKGIATVEDIKESLKEIGIE